MAGASEAADDGEDRSTWAGVVPLERTWGTPVASTLTPMGTPVPDSVLALTTATRADDRLPDGRRCAMFAIMLMLGALAASAITAAVVQFRRDGYRRIPTLQP